MKRPVKTFDVERELLKKIQVAESAYNVSPHGSVKEAAMRELQRLFKELEEVRNPKR